MTYENNVLDAIVSIDTSDRPDQLTEASIKYENLNRPEYLNEQIQQLKKDNETRHIYNQMMQVHLSALNQEKKGRLIFSLLIFISVLSYIGYVFFILTHPNNFHLTEKILIT